MNRFRVIDSFDGFLGIAEAWNELVKATEVDHVFMKHEWFASWIKAYDVRDSLSLVSVWSDGQLAAVAPLYRTGFDFRKVKARGLKFLSSGISPRCSFIVADNHSLDVLVEKTLSLDDWDILFTENMEEETVSTKRYIELLSSCRKKYSFKIDEGRRSPYMMVNGAWEDYWNSLSSKRRNNLKSHLKRLEKAGSYEFTRVTSSEEFDRVLPLMFEISRKSWKAGSNGHLRADSPEGKFFTSFTPTALDRGWVSLYVLRVEGKMIGFDYILSDNGINTGSRSDFDEDYKYYRPGSALKLLIVREFFSIDNIREFDWGGDPDPYKLEWCNHIRKHITVTVGNRNLMGLGILYTKKTLLPSLRALAGFVLPGK